MWARIRSRSCCALGARHSGSANLRRSRAAGPGNGLDDLQVVEQPDVRNQFVDKPVKVSPARKPVGVQAGLDRNVLLVADIAGLLPAPLARAVLLLGVVEAVGWHKLFDPVERQQRARLDDRQVVVDLARQRALGKPHDGYVHGAETAARRWFIPFLSNNADAVHKESR